MGEPIHVSSESLPVILENVVVSPPEVQLPKIEIGIREQEVINQIDLGGDTHNILEGIANNNTQSIVVTIATGGSLIMELSKQATFSVDVNTGV
jgi:hypothetical protein